MQCHTNAPIFKEREVWWCSIGANIGDEEDGKNEFFSRPVLVVRKFNKKIFWGVPLSTQIKDNPNYCKIFFKDKIQCAMLTQLRLFDRKRLTKKMGQLSSDDGGKIRKALREFIL